MEVGEPVVIDWRYRGRPDALLGTGATRAEKVLPWLAGLAGVLLYAYLYASGPLDWALWQFIIAAAIACDVGAGVVANSLNSCKRFYHTPAREDEPVYVHLVKRPLVFSALHVYPILVGLLFGGLDWFYSLFWYGMLLACSLGVLRTPLYLRRPVAMFAVLLALIINLYAVTPVSGFEWLMPALFLKIVYGHLVREEPYRPADLS